MSTTSKVPIQKCSICPTSYIMPIKNGKSTLNAISRLSLEMVFKAIVNEQDHNKSGI